MGVSFSGMVRELTCRADLRPDIPTLHAYASAEDFLRIMYDGLSPKRWHFRQIAPIDHIPGSRQSRNISIATMTLLEDRLPHLPHPPHPSLVPIHHITRWSDSAATKPQASSLILLPHGATIDHHHLPFHVTENIAIEREIKW